MRKSLKKLLVVACATILAIGSSTITSAADDIVLNDSGSPFIKTFDPGTSGDYKYMGYVYCFEVTSEYKYLQITYTGDATAFDELRLEFVVNTTDPAEEKKLTPCWFRENDEGTLLTTDGGVCPNPSSTEQTAVIDLEKSGLDLSTGIRAFHVHDTPGKGTFTITDARLMTSAPAGTASQSDKKASTSEDKKGTAETTVSAADKDSSVSASSTEDGDSVGGGSTAAPSTGSATWPIAIAFGGIVVAGAAFVVSKKIKVEK